LASPTIKAEYLIGRHLLAQSSSSPVSCALRYPLCGTPEVLDALLGLPLDRTHVDVVRLPRWLFRRRLGPSGEEALPLLRYLYGRPDLSVRPVAGFLLASAVRAGAMPLVRFLLERGASPCSKNALAVRFAVKRRDLHLVRLLMDSPKGSSGEAVEVGSNILKFAVKLDARDIAEYLMNEKGCIPDLDTIALLRDR